MKTAEVFRNSAKAIVANLLPEELFRKDIDEEMTRMLFRKFVRVVEIENHNYCNRTCWFCPNAQIDRRGAIQLMGDEIYEKILMDLKSIRFSQTLVWSRYHEPMAHPSFFERIHAARVSLPEVHLTVISNGDYLSRERLRLLELAKVDRVMLDLYLPDGEERNPQELEHNLERFEVRTGLKCVENGSKWEYICLGSTVHVTMGVPQYSYANISTRGGLVDVPELRSYQRRSICFSPLHSVVVDYNGKGMLCCQVRSDAPRHADAIIGDLTQPGYSLFHFYRDLAPARLSLLSPGPKGGPCKTCTISDGGPDKTARRPLIANATSRFWPLTVAVGQALGVFSRRRRWQA